MKNTSGIVFLIAAARARFGKWDVINSAIGDTGRTIRLVIILVATALPAATMAVLVDLLVRR